MKSFVMAAALLGAVGVGGAVYYTSGGCGPCGGGEAPVVDMNQINAMPVAAQVKADMDAGCCPSMDAPEATLVSAPAAPAALDGGCCPSEMVAMPAAAKADEGCCPSQAAVAMEGCGEKADACAVDMSCESQEVSACGDMVKDCETSCEVAPAPVAKVSEK